MSAIVGYYAVAFSAAGLGFDGETGLEQRRFRFSKHLPENCSVAGCLFKFGADPMEFHDAPLEFVEEEVDDGCGEQGQQL